MIWSSIDVTPRKWSSLPRLWPLTPLDARFCICSPLGPQIPRWPRPLLSSLDPRVVPHSKVMRTVSIKKSFTSEFLYLTYPSSERSCYSNELVSQMPWRKGRVGEGHRLGEENPFQKLSCEDPGAGRGGAEGRLFLNWNAYLVSPPFSRNPLEQLAKGVNRQGSSFCLPFLCI